MSRSQKKESDMQLSVFPKQKHQFFFALGVVFLAFGVFSTMSAYKNEDAIQELQNKYKKAAQQLINFSNKLA